MLLRLVLTISFKIMLINLDLSSMTNMVGACKFTNSHAFNET